MLHYHIVVQFFPSLLSLLLNHLKKLKGFCKHTGHHYSDDIYKAETTEPRKVSRNDFVISEAFVWVKGKYGLGHYE